jgi:hypothetical protein
MLINSQAKQIVNQYIGYSDAVAGGAGDDTAVVNAAGIDTKNYSSALVVVNGTTTLGDADTLNLTVATTECDTLGGTYTAKETLSDDAVIATGDTGGSTEAGSVGYVIDLDDYERYVKFSFTPDLSAANTDTADLSYSVILCNATEQPVSVPNTTLA